MLHAEFCHFLPPRDSHKDPVSVHSLSALAYRSHDARLRRNNAPSTILSSYMFSPYLHARWAAGGEKKPRRFLYF